MPPPTRALVYVYSDLSVQNTGSYYGIVWTWTQSSCTWKITKSILDLFGGSTTHMGASGSPRLKMPRQRLALRATGQEHIVAATTENVDYVLRDHGQFAHDWWLGVGWRFFAPAVWFQDIGTRHALTIVMKLYVSGQAGTATQYIPGAITANPFAWDDHDTPVVWFSEWQQYQQQYVCYVVVAGRSAQSTQEPTPGIALGFDVHVHNGSENVPTEFLHTAEIAWSLNDVYVILDKIKEKITSPSPRTRAFLDCVPSVPCRRGST